MKFEWDEPKNQINIRKHELDFFDAWEVFQYPILIEADDRHDYGEPRFSAIGYFVIWLCCWFSQSEKMI